MGTPMEIQGIQAFPDIDSARDGIRDLFAVEKDAKDKPVIARGFQGDFDVDLLSDAAKAKEALSKIPLTKGSLRALSGDDQDEWDKLRSSMESNVEQFLGANDTNAADLRRCRVSVTGEYCAGVVKEIVPFMDFVVPYFRADLGITDAMYAIRIKRKDKEIQSMKADVIYIAKQDLILPVLWSKWWAYVQSKNKEKENQNAGK